MSNKMLEGMRWFGPNDSVSLNSIRQTGATEIFTSLHEIPYGDPWPLELICKRRDEVAASGLTWSHVESVPVHEAIKTRTGEFQMYIENYKESIRNLGTAGVRVVVYNFMPVLDWVRTDLRHILPDGTESLLYDPVKFAAFDLFALQRVGAEKDFTEEQRAGAKVYWEELGAEGQAQFTRQTLDLFPGVKLGMQLDGMRALLANYAHIDEPKLQEHLKLFLEEIVPVAEASGVRLAIHPDDPPFSVLGLPRIVSTEAHLRAITEMVPSPANGLCFCPGSLTARGDQDMVGIVRRLGHRFNAVHLRNVKLEKNGVFWEANHLEGSYHMAAVVHAILQEQAKRVASGRVDWQLTLRPDHGHVMLDDLLKPMATCPGYSLIGRMRGLAEIRGVMHGLALLMSESSASPL